METCFTHDRLISPGGDELTEEKSDRCMAGLLGTGDAKQQCMVDDECWRLMSAPGKASYYLTHQLLFFVLGEQVSFHKLSTIKPKR